SAAQAGVATQMQNQAIARIATAAAPVSKYRIVRLGGRCPSIVLLPTMSAHRWQCDTSVTRHLLRSAAPTASSRLSLDMACGGSITHPLRDSPNEREIVARCSSLWRS